VKNETLEKNGAVQRDRFAGGASIDSPPLQHQLRK